MSACAYCGDATASEYHLDHVVPRSRGGPDTPRNIVQACAPCNTAKSDQLPSEWLDNVPPVIATIERKMCEEFELRTKSARGANYVFTDEYRNAILRVFEMGGGTCYDMPCVSVARNHGYDVDQLWEDCGNIQGMIDDPDVLGRFFELRQLALRLIKQQRARRRRRVA